MRFRTTIELAGKTATGFRVPAEVVASLGSRKRPPVNVTIGDHTYRSTVAVYGDEFFLPLNAQNRAAAGVVAGQEVEVELNLDTEPRQISVPADLATALAAEPAAAAFFDQLSFSHQREYVQWIEEAKRPATRTRRVERAVEQLREGRTQR